MNTERKGYFCDVIPVVPIPVRNRQMYSYLSDDAVPEGSLVTIPFGPRTVRGIVASCGKIADGTLPSGRFKNIRSVIRESFLTPRQLELVFAVSETCLTPLGKTLRHFLPAIVKERAGTGPSEGVGRPLRLTKPEKIAAEAVGTIGIGKTGFLRSDMRSALRIVSGRKRSSKDRGQSLVLVPETVSLPFVERFLTETFGRDRIAVLESRKSAGSFFTAWERIRSGEAETIVGTRQALFAPFRNLSSILVLEEGEVLGYKQWDMSPRYDARRVAETLGSIHGARVVLSGNLPSLDMTAGMKRGDVVPLPKPDTTGTVTTTLVNMREERFRKNRSVISEAARSAIADTLAHGKRSILVASRGGLDSFSVCESCKSVPRCPECDRALRSTRDGNFRCPSCSYKTTSFPRCATCGSLSFRNVGSGTEKIGNELRRAFPGARIVRVDEESVRKDKTLRPDAMPVTLETADILIGTPSVLNAPYLPDTSLVAIMDTDNFLAIPDFRGDERFLRMISLAAGSVRSEDGTGTVLLQTFHPERDFFRKLTEGDLEGPLRNAGKDREALRYPPYGSLFRIGFREREEEKAGHSAEAAYERLSAAVAAIDGASVSRPMKPLIPKVRGRYERLILVTLPPRRPFPGPLADILRSLPGNWTFDPDPLTIL